MVRANGAALIVSLYRLQLAERFCGSYLKFWSFVFLFTADQEILTAVLI